MISRTQYDRSQLSKQWDETIVESRMGRILLIDPGPAGQQNVHIPLALLHVAKPLTDHGYEVNILDTRIHDYRSIVLDDVTCVGITTMTSAVQISSALRVARYIKETKENIPIIWGGTHPSILPEETLKDPNVDIVVRGEGEATFLELVQRIDVGNSWNDVKGITYATNGRVISNSDRELMDLNKIGNLPYNLIKKENYPKIRFAFDYLSSKGCPHRCAFCCDINNRRRMWRAKSAAVVVRELEYIIDEFNPERVVFVDANFFVSKKRVEEICQSIKERRLNLKFQVSCRFDYFARFENSFLELLKASGFDELVMGAESGSDRMLDFIQKDISADQILKSVNRCRKYDIKPVISFVTGFPTETQDDLNRTLDLYDEIMRINSNAEVNGFFIFMPYPGCTLYDYIKNDYNYLPAESLQGWANVRWWEETGFPWVTRKKHRQLQTIHLIVRFFFIRKLLNEWSFEHMKARVGNSVVLACAVKLLMKILSLPARIRWRLKFFSHAIEWRVWKIILAHFLGQV